MVTQIYHTSLAADIRSEHGRQLLFRIFTLECCTYELPTSNSSAYVLSKQRNQLSVKLSHLYHDCEANSLHQRKYQDAAGKTRIVVLLVRLVNSNIKAY